MQNAFFANFKRCEIAGLEIRSPALTLRRARLRGLLHHRRKLSVRGHSKSSNCGIVVKDHIQRGDAVDVIAIPDVWAKPFGFGGRKVPLAFRNPPEITQTLRCQCKVKEDWDDSLPGGHCRIQPKILKLSTTQDRHYLIRSATSKLG